LTYPGVNNAAFECRSHNEIESKMMKTKYILVAILAISWLSGNAWAQTCGSAPLALKAAEKLAYEVDVYYRLVHGARPFAYGYAEVYYSGTGLNDLRDDTRMILNSANCLANNAEAGRDMDVAEGCRALKFDTSSLQRDIHSMDSTIDRDSARYRTPGAENQWRKVMQAYQQLLDAIGA